MAFTARVNIEMVNTKYYSALPGLVKSGKIPESVLDEAVKEILTLKFKLGLFDKPYTDARKMVEISNDPASKEVALETANRQLSC